jgi:His-Xaa-Ser system radical SAM maturase HxsB
MALAKRFSAVETFRAGEQAGYRLLPLRFTALDQNRYVVSNMVGEYLVVKRDQLNDLIRHRLPHGSDLYDDFKSRHFIRDADSDVVLDLLALKYRTKLARVSQFTSLHMFVVTLRCDYTCAYCQVSRQTEDRSAYDMSDATASAAVEMTFRSPAPAIKIEFQGGEPLLAFDRIKSVVEIAEARNAQESRNLQFVIASNLSLISDQILDYCDRHDIYFSTSLDGPSSLHDRNRPKPGKNGYELTIRGIKRIQARLGRDRVSALMTTTERSLSHVKEIIDEYVRLGFRSIFLRPLSPYGFAVSTGQVEKYDTERWLSFYREGLSYILELNKHGYSIRETYAAIILRKMLTPQNPGYVDLQSPTGLGISAIVYNYDGAVYASDESRMLAEMGDYSFRLGQLGANSYEEMMLSTTLLDALEAGVAEGSPLCSECAFVPYCGADPVYHHATQRDMMGNKALSGYCARNMAIFRHLIALMEDSPADRSILLRWAFDC